MKRGSEVFDIIKANLTQNNITKEKKEQAQENEQSDIQSQEDQKPDSEYFKNKYSKKQEKQVQLRRYQSSSIDEEEFINYQENPILRQQFDETRQKQQMREIQNIDQFMLVSYGFKTTKAEALVIAQAKILDAEKKEEEEKEPIEDEDNVPTYAAVSLCCLSSSNPFRSRIIVLIFKNPWFQRFIIMAIISNSLIMAMDQEVDLITDNGDTIDLVYLIVYSMEMILKIIAMGFFMETNSYLRDPWNILDFFVVSCGWLGVFVKNPSIAQIKILRILRPLKLIKKVPGMPKLVSTIIDSIPIMVDVMVLFMFFILLMAVISTQILGGILLNRCQGLDSDGNLYYLLGNEQKEFLCTQQSQCDIIKDLEGEPPNQTYQCLYYGNPWDGNLNYDNFLTSAQNIFITIALEAFMDQMYYVRNAQGGILYDPLYLANVFVGNFVILVLLINVQAFFLDQAFDKDDHILAEKNEKLALKTHTNNMYLQKIKLSVKKNDNDQQQSIKKVEKTKVKKRKKSKIQICCTQFKEQMLNICEQEYFKKAIMAVIILNTFVMASEFYDQPMWMTLGQLYLNYTFTGIFTFEMIFKMIGYGLTEYSQDAFNLFDCFIVCMSFVDIIVSNLTTGGGSLAIIKAFRLLRIFKLFKEWDAVKKLIATLVKSIKPIINLGVLMILFMFISSLLLKSLAGAPLTGYDGSPDRFGFNTTTQAMITNFIYMTGDNWPNMLNDTEKAFGNPIMFLIMLVLFTLGHFMLLNLFLCVLLRAMSQGDDDNDNEQQINDDNIENTNQNPSNQSIDEGKKEKTILKKFQSIFQNKQEDEIKIQESDNVNQNDQQLKNQKKYILEEQKLFEEQQKQNEDKLIVKKLIQREEIKDQINQKEKSRQDEVDSLQSNVDIEVKIIQDQIIELAQTLQFQQQIQRAETSLNKDKKGKKSTNKQKRTLQMKQNIDDDENKKIQQNLNNQQEYPQDFSLFIFDKKGLFRIQITSLINGSYYNSFLNHIIGLSTILMMLDEPQLNDNYQIQALTLMVNITSSVFIIEFLLSVISKGFYYGEEAYLKSNWNILDFTIVIITIFSWILEALLPNASFVKGFRALRALRPLKIVSTNESLKIVVYSIFEAVPELASVSMIVILFNLIFGILGIQLFKGSVGSCNDQDPSILTKQDCVGFFNSSVTLPNGLNLTLNDTEREWEVAARNYDNIFNSMLTFFEVQSFENWSDAMFAAVDTVGYDQVQVQDNRKWVLLIYVFFIFTVSFFILNLFISVIVDKFNDEISEFQGTNALELHQKEWIKIQKLMVLTKPKRLPIIPFNQFRLKCFKLVQTDAFEYLSVLAITINTIFLCIDHYGQGEDVQDMLFISNIVMTIYFSIEIILKLIAYGFSFFWSQVWNKFDAVIVFLSIIGLLEKQIQSLGINVKLLRIIRVTRLLRIIKVSSGLRKLLKILLLSLPNILNVFFILILIWFVFTIVGMSVYSNMPFVEQYSENANFRSFYMGIMMMIRASTGGAWTDLMHEMREEMGISSVFFWVSFVVGVQLILMNVFIAVIGESFDANQETEDPNDIITLKKKDIKSFISTWAIICPLGEDMMKTTRLPNFLKTLPPPLGYKGINLTDQMILKIIFCLNIKDQQGKLYYPNVMWPVFHSLGGFNSENVLKCQEMVGVMKQIKKSFKKLPKSITLDQLCGNIYLGNQLPAIQHIYGQKILHRLKLYMQQKKLKHRKDLANQFNKLLIQIKQKEKKEKEKQLDEKKVNRKQLQN